MHSPELAERLSASWAGRSPRGACGWRCSGRATVSWGSCSRRWRVRWESPTPDELEEELIDLGLLEYCRPVLKRQGSPL